MKAFYCYVIVKKIFVYHLSSGTVIFIKSKTIKSICSTTQFRINLDVLLQDLYNLCSVVHLFLPLWIPIIWKEWDSYQIHPIVLGFLIRYQFMVKKQPYYKLVCLSLFPYNYKSITEFIYVNLIRMNIIRAYQSQWNEILLYINVLYL